MSQIFKLCTLLCLGACCVIAWPSLSFATSSPNYRIGEDFVGGSGTAGGGSNNFRSQDTVGGAALGESNSATFKTQSGAATTSDASLNFSVNTASVNLGSLSHSATKTATATFSVKNYTSYGYIVHILGNPPSNGAHTLTAMGTPASSSVGAEQFGINLAANTSPALGANPQQTPNNSFGFGSAASQYNVANTFKYASGNVVALASKSSGQTDYTISYIANAAITTPGGSYFGNQTLVCTGTY